MFFLSVIPIDAHWLIDPLTSKLAACVGLLVGLFAAVFAINFSIDWIQGRLSLRRMSKEYD